MTSRLAVALVSAALLILYIAAAQFCPAGWLSLSVFGVSATLYLALTLSAFTSTFTFAYALFLLMGFYLKFILHFGTGTALIEPVGSFDGSKLQWEAVLNASSSGLLGALAATLVCRTFRSAPTPGRLEFSSKAAPPLRKLLIGGLAAAFVIYAINARWNILRIGYPPGIELPHPIYPILAFVISWGALLGSMTVICWIAGRQLHALSYAIYISAFLGFAASLTMGSRVQFLLYGFAATITIVLAAGVRGLMTARVAGGYAIAALLFAFSIAGVSLQRNLDFFNPQSSTAFDDAAAKTRNRSSEIARMHEKPLPSRPVSRPTVETGEHTSSGQLRDAHSRAIPISERLHAILFELKSLVVMRWVGLEGVMTAVGTGDRAGPELMLTMLRERPDLGTNSTYQRLSGDRYLDVRYFTFLTLPGPIGIAAFSGSLIVVAVMSVLVVLLGHGIEWFTIRLTNNVGSAAVIGVSLAYLSVQMCFPWTLLLYVLEAMVAVVMIGIVGFLLGATFPARQGKAVAS